MKKLKMQKPEQVIAEFLMTNFDDERLAKLLTDAVAGKVPFADPTTCLVGHSAEDFLDAWGYDSVQNRRRCGRASTAYRQLADSHWTDLFLPYDMSDKRKMKRLIPLINAEIARRAALRAEAVRAAVETCKIVENEVVEGAGV